MSQPIKECPVCHAPHWDVAGCDNCGHRQQTIEELFAEIADRYGELLKNKTRKG